jgi:hypothetical protein
MPCNGVEPSSSFGNGTGTPYWYPVVRDRLFIYSLFGNFSGIITAADPSELPTDLFLPAGPDDSDSKLATVGKYREAFVGPLK